MHTSRRRSSATNLTLPLATALLCAVPAPAQVSAPVAAVEIVNTTQQAGQTVADVVLPLAKGLLRATPALQTDRGRMCQVRPMGPTWPDGSLRYLKCDLPVDVKAGERRRVLLYPLQGKPHGFVPHQVIKTQLPGVKAWFRVGDEERQFTDAVLVEQGPLVHVYRSRLRFANSCIWAELHTLVMHGVGHLRFYLSWGNSNPLSRLLHEDPGLVAFAIAGADLLVDEEPSKVLKSLTWVELGQIPVRGRVVLLHSGGYLADGQAQCFEGRIVLTGGAPRVRALAHGWPTSGAFGPFGELIPEAQVSEKTWQKMLAADRKNHSLHPWAEPAHGCNPDPASTGSQKDFGVLKMREDLVRVDPSRLHLITRSVFQESCRPTHYREFDVRPVTIANHPKLVLLAGRPHFRSAALG